MANKVTKHIAVVSISAVLLSVIVGSDATESTHRYAAQAAVMQPVIDTPITDPIKLPYPYTDQSAQDPLNYPNSGGLLLNNPSNINTEVEYDPATGNYNISQKMGEMNFRPPTYMDKNEYEQYRFNQQVKSYWNQRVSAESPKNKNNAIIPKLNVGGEVFDRIFGGNTVDIRPNGSAELIFGYNGTKTKNPALPVRQQKSGTFVFDQKINLNVIGKIGDKLKLTTSFNTESTFDFETQMKLEYTGYEDEIIKKIEAGNVSMPLNGSLITGSQTLFGVKTQLQFGKLMVTAIASQQKGKKSEIEVTGGAQITPFEVAGDAYEANKHYFLGQYFRDTYNAALAQLPFVNSQITINRIEVWVSNTNATTTDVRSVVGFTELGEDEKHIPDDIKSLIVDSLGIYPSNGQNNLYNKIKGDSSIRITNTAVKGINRVYGNVFKQQVNFELFNARKLQPSEYTLNTKLGYISLNQQLNPEQVLSVAYQYTVNGKLYQVGEFSDGGITAPQALYAKMLKSSNTTSTVKNGITGKQVHSELWNLMMKNVYSLGAYQISPKDFKLDVLYFNAGSYINYLPEPGEPKLKSTPLLQVLKLDSLNQQNDQQPDGVFDFIDGVTINASNGRLIFPVIEPFGDRIRSQFTIPLKANIYAFDQLYDSSRTVATSQYPNLNRYKIKGQYESSSSSDISLGAPNVPEGSVMVTAGGTQLVENTDYTVDYTLGRVKIINDGILNSGTPIKVSLESNALFAIQSKTLLGTHLDYRINKDFNIGGTVLNLTERPITKKVNIGDEPVSNTIWGFDGNYSSEAPFLTRWIDKLPLLETKEISTITAAAEFAYLIPGHSKAIGKAGNSYVDDFEGSQTTIDLKTPDTWRIASTPQGQPALFPEGNLKDTVAFGFNRAALSWYVIDPILLSQQSGQSGQTTPSSITKEVMSHNFMRGIREQEVFPSKQSANGISNLNTLDLAYYPSERGPYNYDVRPSNISKGLDPTGEGNLAAPQTRWGGMMRALSTNDFEAQNVEYIQFWVMDPFNDDVPVADRNTTGDLYFNIGNISEDVLNDSYKSSENVLPAPSTSDQNGGANLPVEKTAWGYIPTTQPLVNAFNSDPKDRAAQDVGLDGLDNATEKTFFAKYLNEVNAYAPTAYNTISNDPSADDFHYFRGDDYDASGLNTLQRYKKWTGMENNSPAATNEYSKASTQNPNTEDINRDNTLSTVESYYQYHISLKPSAFQAGVGSNYITDVFKASVRAENGRTKEVNWYQFKIPLKTSKAEKIGQIENFQSIRFLRMYFKNVDKPIVLRFAKLDLVRGEWRKYGYDLLAPGLYEPNDNNTTQFDVSAVNIEENGNKQPVNYVLPPGIDREINAGTAQLLAQNEQAMSLNVCGLKNGDSRAAFKNTQLDVRQYKTLKMYVHAEGAPNPGEVLNDNDLHMFIRLGTDYTDNYYEYDIPLKVTPRGNYNGTNEDDQKKVWPDENEMILSFDKLYAAKKDRNNEISQGKASLNKEYSTKDGNRKISVKGNPNLSAVRIIMIGVRNPAKQNTGDNDDGLPKCGQIWVNELRLSDFDQTGGWATNARVTAKLADFGNLALSGSMYTPGFGSIENKVNERKKETSQQYDISSSLELGKFIPEKYNVHVPMYVGYSQVFITPQFNPLDPDILLVNQLKDPTIDKKIRDTIRDITQDRTTRKSINFTNVKKDKSANATKSKVYDIENWAATYSYSEISRKNVNTVENKIKNYRGGLIYNYSFAPKNIKPFDKIKIFQSKYFQLIKDINFYLVPNNVGFSTDVDREYAFDEKRNVTGGDFTLPVNYSKRFNINRNYNFKYDIAKGLNVDFTANNQERVLEPLGKINDSTLAILKKEFFDRLKKTQYNQQVNVNYTIPINKLPLLDFTSASVRYGSTYNWTHSPLFNTQKDNNGKLIIKDTLGNLITNSQSIQWSGQLTMTTLYNKIPYFKKVNQNNRKPAVKPATQSKTPADSSSKKEDSFQIMDHIARFIMSLKTVSGSYSTTDGTVLPGYRPNMQVLGLDEHFAGPTVGFTLGSQKDITKEAISKNWLVKTSSLNSPYQLTNSKKLNLRANLEPLRDLRIELTALQSQSTVKSQIIRWDRTDSLFIYDRPLETGSFSMTYISYRTSFKKGDAVFNDFLNARSAVSARLKEKNSNSTSIIDGYAQGYNETSQDVLIPSFLASYGGKNPNSVSLNQFPKIPKPNWRITYDGLSKLESIKKYFKSFTLSNAYTSTYNVNSYTTNLLYQQDARGNANAFESASTFSNNPNFISQHTINNITLSENWSPLIRVDMTLNNSLAINCEYKKGRSLSLGLSSRTITEMIDQEIVVGTGYRIKDVQLGKRFMIKGKPIKSDLNLKADLSFRNNQTIMRQIVERISQATGGTIIISLKIAADYIINERISIRAFYDRIITKPVTSLSFPTTNTNAGVSLRLTLSN